VFYFPAKKLAIQFGSKGLSACRSSIQECNYASSRHPNHSGCKCQIHMFHQTISIMSACASCVVTEALCVIREQTRNQRTIKSLAQLPLPAGRVRGRCVESPRVPFQLVQYYDNRSNPIPKRGILGLGRHIFLNSRQKDEEWWTSWSSRCMSGGPSGGFAVYETRKSIS
jgi:hypothetical protein